MSNYFDERYFRHGKKSNFLHSYEEYEKLTKWKSKIDKVLKYKTKGKILDIGCAFGYFLKNIGKSFKLYGIDISEYAIGRAKKILPKAKLICADASESMPFQKNYFDVVTAFHVIEHVKHPESIIKNIKKVLKPGGYLFLEAPINFWFRKIIKYFDKDKSHISILSISEYIKLLEKNGFKIVETERMLDDFRKIKYRFLNPLGCVIMIVARK